MCASCYFLNFSVICFFYSIFVFRNHNDKILKTKLHKTLDDVIVGIHHLYTVCDYSGSPPTNTGCIVNMHKYAQIMNLVNDDVKSVKSWQCCFDISSATANNAWKQWRNMCWMPSADASAEQSFKKIMSWNLCHMLFHCNNKFWC